MEDPSPAQDSTPVRVPDLPLSTYQALVARLAAQCPAERPRLLRALDVLLGCTIVEADALGRYRVQSCRASATYYTATSWSCTCPDRQRHDGRCKHAWALTLLSVATALAAREAAEAGAWLTPAAAAALAAL